MKTVYAMGLLGILATGCGVQQGMDSDGKSITNPDYQGKKYYFGFGLNGNGNDSMDNEVKYDVQHTHDIFTRNVGGDYIGRKLIGESEVNGRAIKGAWSDISGRMQAQDMFLQYSSGHGYQGGLSAGVTYNDIVNATLNMPGKEKVIFTMACYSGGLINSFNTARSRWADYQAQGRTLFVMASSRASEESSTGPGTDPDERDGADGSAGSAFGHAVWKALIGYADGAVDNQRDGKLMLDEIIKYVVTKTQQEGGHTPQFTGAYDPKLHVANVPTFDQAAALLGDTAEGRERLNALVMDGVLQ